MESKEKMKIFKEGELNLLWPFYLEKFLSHLLFFLPAFWIISFYSSITLTQIGIIFSISSAISFLFEIPTGAFADIYGRKASTLVGYFFSGLAMLSIFFFKSFMGILMFMSIWSIAGTFISGAKESWVIDNIKQKKKDHLIKSFFLKQQFVMGLSLLLSGILGTFVVKYLGIEIAWIFASASFLLTFVILLFIPEANTIKKRRVTFERLFSQSKKSIKYALKHSILFFMLFATFFILLRESFGGDINEQVFLKLLGLPIPYLGLFFSGIALLMLLAPIMASLILKKFSSKKSILSLLLIFSIILDIGILFVNTLPMAILLISLIVFLVFLFHPIEQVYMQEQIPSKMRATITSFQSMSISLGYVVGAPFAGFFGDLIGPQKTIVLGAVFLVPALILYLKIKDKKN